MGLSLTEYIGVGIISAAIFIILFLLLLGGYGSSTGNRGSYGQTSIRATNQPVKTYIKPLPSPQTFLYSGIYNNVKTSQPTTFFHGTTREKAIKIYRSGLWLIGSSLPYAVWMGDKVEIARQYSGFGKNGAIVVINVDPDIDLTNRGDGVYIYEVPGAIPRKEYYKIDGLVPIDVVDSSGKSII